MRESKAVGHYTKGLGRKGEQINAHHPLSNLHHIIITPCLITPLWPSFSAWPTTVPGCPLSKMTEQDLQALSDSEGGGNNRASSQPGSDCSPRLALTGIRQRSRLASAKAAMNRLEGKRVPEFQAGIGEDCKVRLHNSLLPLHASCYPNTLKTMGFPSC